MSAMMFRLRYQLGLTAGNCDRGYSLLLAVIIISAVLTAASALARIVISEIRQTREVGSAIVAHADAESRVEQSIFLLRQTELNLADIQSRFENLTLELETRPQYSSIAQNDFASFPVDQDVPANSVTPRIVRWELADPQCPGWIEVAAIAWDPAQTPPFLTNRHSYSYTSDRAALADGSAISFPSGARPLELRVKALYCDITELGVEGVPGRILIESIGEEGDVRQAIETLVVRQSPAGGLFDYVIFSECSLIKGENVTPACP